jgi:hypothetical protein
MKSGCAFAFIFGVAALVIVAMLAPILFPGADMHEAGRICAWPVLIIGGVIGYLFGRSRQM